MEPIYRQTYSISDVAVDRYGRLRPSMLLSYAQDIAVRHCTALDLDWDTLARRKLFWAVIRHRAQISRLPGPGEEITVETWPMPTTKVAYPRSTVACDAQGNELFRTISLWVLMDLDNRNMVLPGKSGVDVEGLIRGTELTAPNGLIPRPLSHRGSRVVAFSDLDRNGHMNNTRYLDWLDDLLPSAFHAGHPMREFTVCYLSEGLEGQTLQTDWELLDGPILRAETHRQKADDPTRQERVFAAQVLFE